jgi:hypothetical protein
MIKAYRRLSMDQEKELIGLFRKMDRETKDLFLSHGRIALVAEEAGKKAILEQLSPLCADQSPAPIAGPDTPLFNGTRTVPGPAA